MEYSPEPMPYFEETMIREVNGVWHSYHRCGVHLIANGATEFWDEKLQKVFVAWDFTECCKDRAILHCESYNKPGDPPNWSAFEEYIAHKCKVNKVGNGTYKGKWAFTLTCSPSDGLTKDDLLKAVRKVMNQRSQPVLKYAWHFEHKGLDAEGKPQHPHIHGMYELVSGGRIEAKHWKRAWKVWDEKIKMGQGFRGGYHRPVRAEEAYSDYIAEDGLESENNLEVNNIE